MEIINNDLGIKFPEHLNNSDIDQDILYKLDCYIKQYTSLTNDQSLKMAAQTQHMIYQNNDICGNYIILQTYNYTHWVGCKKYVIYHPTDLQKSIVSKFTNIKNIGDVINVSDIEYYGEYIIQIKNDMLIVNYTGDLEVFKNAKYAARYGQPKYEII